MPNDFYNSTGYPQTGAGGSSANMRSELQSIQQGFDKMPALSGNAGKLVKINAAGTLLEASSVISDDGTNATVSGDLIVTGGDIGKSAGQIHTIPAVTSDTFTLNAAAQTLTNKTIVAATNTIITAASGNLTSTSLDAALAELQTDIDTRATSTALTTHTGLATGAHAATAISSSPAGNLAATTVQAALNELDAEKLALTGGTLTGNLGFSGTGLRLTGDFSNATVANRVMFQTSTVNGATSVAAIGNGPSGSSGFSAFTGSDPNNASILSLRALGTGETRIDSQIVGTGTYLPMTFYTGGSERMRIDASGNVGIGMPPESAAGVKFLTVGSASEAGIFQARLGSNDARLQVDSFGVFLGTFSNIPTLLFTNSTEKLRIGTDGTVTVSTPAGLGYGTGAGGTVTQATSKSTTVTLNKPTGQITMNNAALAAGTTVAFTFNNSILGAADTFGLHIQGGTADAGNYIFSVTNMASGSCLVLVTNRSGGSLSEALVLSYTINKGSVF